MATGSAVKPSLRPDRRTPARSNLPSNPRPKSRRTAAGVVGSKLHSSHDDADSVSGRVRVAVRLRPRNAEDLASDADFADCVELQPELKRLILRKNSWSSETYKFDEVLTDSASQKRVYEVVAKPVVESVIDGYNGTVMAYGQTGTGKTFTIGRVGREDPSECGIMVRALEDILAATSLASDTIAVSYLQLYLECLQDLLAPEKSNIQIIEDSKTGEISLPEATLVKIKDLSDFLHLLEIGEANRHAANTKLNTESSRSHAILLFNIQRSVNKVVGSPYSEEDPGSSFALSGSNIPTIIKSKLLIVDLAGSERIQKSGSEGQSLEEAKFINLSLTSLGKCINALAENSSHIPIRDSKLTRLLRDSFGGSARTSLVITLGPSSRHHAETSSTIMFGQRVRFPEIFAPMAMKVVNMLKLKEEFDYESLCRKLQSEVDYLIVELEKANKFKENECKRMDQIIKENEISIIEAERSFNEKYELLEDENARLNLEMQNLMGELNSQKEKNNLMYEEVACLESLQEECSTYQNVLSETTHMYEKKIMDLKEQIDYEKVQCKTTKEELVSINRAMVEQHSLQLQKQNELKELVVKFEELFRRHDKAMAELQHLKAERGEILSEKAILYQEVKTLQEKLSSGEKLWESMEHKVFKLKKIVSDVNETEVKRSEQHASGQLISRFASPKTSEKSKHQHVLSGQKGSHARSFEEVDLQKLFAFFKSEDEDVQINAVKRIANLAAEDANQEKIVQEGGLDSLLSLLRSTRNPTIYRVASGAIANLAMNVIYQGLIVSKGGVRLLANITAETDDPQALRMVAGAIANLCGNERLHSTLVEHGGTKALSTMLRCQQAEVTSQIARGFANFAKGESRRITQGYRKGRSILIEDGAVEWLLANSKTDSDSTRRHIELAICHLAQNEDNAEDLLAAGAMRELARISRESSNEEIRYLAKRTLKRTQQF